MLVAGCGGGSSSSKPLTKTDQFVKSFNENALNLGPHATSNADKQEIIKIGRDFCASMNKHNDDDNAAKKDIERNDGVPSTMAGVIFLAATDKGSLCPVG